MFYNTYVLLFFFFTLKITHINHRCRHYLNCFYGIHIIYIYKVHIYLFNIGCRWKNSNIRFNIILLIISYSYNVYVYVLIRVILSVGKVSLAMLKCTTYISHASLWFNALDLKFTISAWRPYMMYVILYFMYVYTSDTRVCVLIYFSL